MSRARSFCRILPRWASCQSTFPLVGVMPSVGFSGEQAWGLASLSVASRGVLRGQDFGCSPWRGSQMWRGITQVGGLPLKWRWWVNARGSSASWVVGSCNGYVDFRSLLISFTHTGAINLRLWFSFDGCEWLFG